jgi:hypothetical protein
VCVCVCVGGGGGALVAARRWLGRAHICPPLPLPFARERSRAMRANKTAQTNTPARAVSPAVHGSGYCSRRGRLHRPSRAQNPRKIHVPTCTGTANPRESRVAMRRGARTKGCEEGRRWGRTRGEGGVGGASGRAGLAHVFASRLRTASMRKSRSVGPVPGLCGRERPASAPQAARAHHAES